MVILVTLLPRTQKLSKHMYINIQKMFEALIKKKNKKTNNSKMTAPREVGSNVRKRTENMSKNKIKKKKRYTF